MGRLALSLVMCMPLSGCIVAGAIGATASVAGTAVGMTAKVAGKTVGVVGDAVFGRDADSGNPEDAAAAGHTKE